MDPTRLDPDAVRAVQRLGARGYESYLVGGCVRDLLVDRDPKDFDIATAARPQQVKRAFPRNCRIIGRRFKLAHLHFHSNQKILEVATFRSSPVPANETESDTELEADNDEEPEETDDADLLIVRDNEFGTVEEDALRRDFTINALFFDPVRDEILDYVGGMEDVADHVIRTIGDPVTRFREDPVRILRAAKFAGRLGFKLDGPTEAAMRAASPDLTRAAPPRILEEILRLLRAGHALPSFQILRNVGGLAVLLPVIQEYLDASDPEECYIFWRMLDGLDDHIHNGGRPSNAVLLGCLFLRPILRRHAAEGSRSPTAAAEEIIGPLAQDLRLPRRDAGALKRICGVQPRFTATGRFRFRMASFLQDPHLLEAFALFELTCYAKGADLDHLASWRERIDQESGHGPIDDGFGDHNGESAAPERGSRPTGRTRSTNKQSGGRRDAAAGTKTQGSKLSRARKESSKPTSAKKSQQQQKKKKTTAKKSTRQTARSPGKKKKDEVLTLEPETYDLSAFDRELSPREVPRFDTIVESNPGGKRRRRTQPTTENDSYKPPPPPGTDGAPPAAPPPADDVFGDW